MVFVIKASCTQRSIRVSCRDALSHVKPKIAKWSQKFYHYLKRSCTLNDINEGRTLNDLLHFDINKKCSWSYCTRSDYNGNNCLAPLHKV